MSKAPASSFPDKINILYKAFGRRGLLKRCKTITGLSIHSLDKYRRGIAHPKDTSLELLASMVGLTSESFRLPIKQFIAELIEKNDLKDKENLLSRIAQRSIKSDSGVLIESMEVHNNPENMRRWMKLFEGAYYIYHYSLDGTGKVVRALMYPESHTDHYLKVRSYWKLRGSVLDFSGIMFRIGDKIYFSLDHSGHNELVHMITNNPANRLSEQGVFFHGVIVAGDDTKSYYRSVPAAAKVFIHQVVDGLLDAETVNEKKRGIGVFTPDDIKKMWADEKNEAKGNSHAQEVNAYDILKFIGTDGEKAHVMRADLS